MKSLFFKTVADHALLVQLDSEISDEVQIRVQQLDKAIANDPPLGLRETIPAFVNLLIEFDPLVTDHEQIKTAVQALWQQDFAALGEGITREVSVCYEDDLARDLEVVSKATGLDPETVINMHLSGDYRVAMYGFAPGYAYMSGVPKELQIPRKQTALRDVPAGSVLIAGPQCLVSTLTMPTGWSIIGRSPTQILRNDPDRPFLFDVGDRVQFRRIDRASFDAECKEQTS